ncbi:MAG: helix-turn-helix domain-containing protein [Cellulomonas sp.]|nr:helix-turn-helix domain-containing protein [Cellulomonas sp.]
MTSTQLNARSLPKLGTAVRALRRRRGLTQAELARRAGVSREWVITVEAGETYGIEVGRLMRLLDALDANLTIEAFDTDETQ